MAERLWSPGSWGDLLRPAQIRLVQPLLGVFCSFVLLLLGGGVSKPDGAALGAQLFLRKLWLVKRLPVFQEEFHQFTQAGKSGFKGDSQTVASIDLACASPPGMLMASFRRVATPADTAHVGAAHSQRCVMKAPPCCRIIRLWRPRRRHRGSLGGVWALLFLFPELLDFT